MAMSSISFDLDLAMDDPAYPGLRIVAEFHALESYLEKLDDAVQFTQDQEIVRFNAMMKKQSKYLGATEVREKREELEYVTSDLVPRFFLGAFVIALSAACESAIYDIGTYVRTKTNVRLKVNDLKEPRTHKRIALDLETVMGTGNLLKKDLEERLEEPSDVRNCLAHSNGNLANEKPDRVRRMEELVKAGCGLSIRASSLLVDAKFGRAYLGHVSEACRGHSFRSCTSRNARRCLSICMRNIRRGMWGFMRGWGRSLVVLV
jgi:hypothetical protein